MEILQGPQNCPKVKTIEFKCLITDSYNILWHSLYVVLDYRAVCRRLIGGYLKSLFASIQVLGGAHEIEK